MLQDNYVTNARDSLDTNFNSSKHTIINKIIWNSFPLKDLSPLYQLIDSGHIEDALALSNRFRINEDGWKELYNRCTDDSNNNATKSLEEWRDEVKNSWGSTYSPNHANKNHPEIPLRNWKSIREISTYLSKESSSGVFISRTKTDFKDLISQISHNLGAGFSIATRFIPG